MKSILKRNIVVFSAPFEQKGILDTVVGNFVEHSLYPCDYIILLLILPRTFWEVVACLSSEALH